MAVVIEYLRKTDFFTRNNDSQAKTKITRREEKHFGILSQTFFGFHYMPALFGNDDFEADLGVVFEQWQWSSDSRFTMQNVSRNVSFLCILGKHSVCKLFCFIFVCLFSHSRVRKQ